MFLPAELSRRIEALGRSSGIALLLRRIARFGHSSRRILKNRGEGARLIIATTVGLVFGFYAGFSFPRACFSERDADYGDSGFTSRESAADELFNMIKPLGAEPLPPGMVVSETDFYLRRLWGNPDEDLPKKQKYLLVFTVGFEQRNDINAAVGKFPDDFQILLFHYDGRTSEWDRFEWAKKAIHVSAREQTKWWFAKRFLHPAVVAAYDYIFIWDEDLGLENFDAEKYIHLAKKHGLEISQPAVESNADIEWTMTKRRLHTEVQKKTTERPGLCSSPNQPPCAAFVEIMAPVFSRKAWRCVWHIIQNDLVHGWGMDFEFRRCVHPAHEKIGVVDAQWIIHQAIPSLRNQGKSAKAKERSKAVSERCLKESYLFENRVNMAEKEFLFAQEKNGGG